MMIYTNPNLSHYKYQSLYIQSFDSFNTVTMENKLWGNFMIAILDPAMYYTSWYPANSHRWERQFSQLHFLSQIILLRLLLSKVYKLWLPINDKSWNKSTVGRPKKVLTAYLFERMHTYRIHISKYALIQISWIKNGNFRMKRKLFKAILWGSNSHI